MTVPKSLSNELIFVLFMCSELVIFVTGESNFLGKVEDIENKFHINSNTIIRTQDSRALGAKYLNETELATNRACLIWCWETASCNVAVFEEKSKGSCYLFDCGSPSNFQCKFTIHNFYTSSILKTTHSYDLSDWGNQVRHENELTKLQGNTASVNGPAPPESSVGAAAKQVIFSTPPANISVSHKNEHRCRHYQFQCLNGSECIAIYNVCDGIPQCPDGSDESTDLKCPNRDENNYKSSSLSPVVQVPTQSSSNQVVNAPSSVFESRVQTSALNSQIPQKPMMAHSSSNRLEPQQPLQNSPSSALGNVGPPTKLLDRNTVWHEGDEGVQDSPQKHGQKGAVGPGSLPSPFIHKHSKFVAANDPHVQFSNRWTDDYEQYPHQPPRQEQYNPYDNSYLNDRYLNNQMTSDFDQGVYDSYHPEQNAYWTGQDPVHGGNYDGNDFGQPDYRGSQRQSSYPEQGDGYPSNQPSGKYINTVMYNRPNQQHGSVRGPPPDQSPNSLQLQRQKAQSVPQYYVPYGEQSQLSYPSYAEPRPVQSDYIPQKATGGFPKSETVDKDYVSSNSRPVDRDYVPKQHPVQEDKSLQSQHPTANVLSNTLLPDIPSNGKETVMPDEPQVTESGDDLLHINPATAVSVKPSKSPNRSHYGHVGNLLEGQKMTVAELYASSNTHVHESNSAVLALALGLCVTALLLVLVGCRMRAIRRRIARKGHSLAHDADYLVNGMYL